MPTLCNPWAFTIYHANAAFFAKVRQARYSWPFRGIFRADSAALIMNPCVAAASGRLRNGSRTASAKTVLCVSVLAGLLYAIK